MNIAGTSSKRMARQARDPNLKSYLCRMKDIDGENDWFEIAAYNASDAAEEYAERCESFSGGELLNGPDTERVFVKNEDGLVETFEITVDYTKNFYATKTNGLPA